MLRKLLVACAVMVAYISVVYGRCECLVECGCQEGFQPNYTAKPEDCCGCLPCIPVAPAPIRLKRCVGVCRMACVCPSGQVPDPNAERPADACCWCKPCIPKEK